MAPFAIAALVACCSFLTGAAQEVAVAAVPSARDGPAGLRGAAPVQGAELARSGESAKWAESELGRGTKEELAPAAQALQALLLDASTLGVAGRLPLAAVVFVTTAVAGAAYEVHLHLRRARCVRDQPILG
eukprot:CAMPEP_0176285056 /NCGR_PEP_ID=MMETSP0121_2-20121125/52169_1 /TAXON_ID=160619 /ORGANISM="Kryptoperidinium foliaceum, Strain CCMP 1326" /LENGTH=130 /DNA_ID=CAMNT_0017625521 /DNA_START=68 /DNA_END=460 /DNA_ORIENTATION=+